MFFWIFVEAFRVGAVGVGSRWRQYSLTILAVVALAVGEPKSGSLIIGSRRFHSSGYSRSHYFS
jgi:hypothetical protein